MNNQGCKRRTKINEPKFYPFSICVNKCSGSCNNLNDPYAKLYVPSSIRNTQLQMCFLSTAENAKVFNLMSRSNQTRHIEWHKTCKCKCRLDSSVCNNKRRWNGDKGRCEWEELIDKKRCDKRCIWNLSHCNCECDKSCDVGQYLDYENCKCRKRIIRELVEECNENFDENEIIYNEILNDSKKNYVVLVQHTQYYLPYF